MPLVAQKNLENDPENDPDGVGNPLAKGQLERTIEPTAVGQETANPIAEVPVAQDAGSPFDADDNSRVADT
jgi:hypothetical protein